MDRGWPQERPNPNPALVDRRGNAVGLLPSFGVRPMAIETLEEYLREFSVEIGDRILTSYPALHAPGDPVSPILGTLLRKPFAAQEVAITGAAKRLQQANSVAIIAEMGTGKTLMAIALAHVVASGRPYACLFVVPPQLLQKTSREIIQTIPGARTYVIDSLRSLRPGQSGPQGVNELRLRNGRIVRDGVHTTLTDIDRKSTRLNS